MFNIIKRRSTHASKLERWIGPNKAAELSALHKDWYGPPIALADVPGEVYCRGGGDFVGNIDAGGFQNLWDYSIKRAKDNLHQAFLYNKSQMATGFATLTALQEAAAHGYQQKIVLVAQGIGGSTFGGDSWRSAAPLGGLAAAAPGGTVFDRASARASAFRNAGSGKTLTTVDSEIAAPGFSTALPMLICDRLFGVAKTMNTTASEAVTGVPTRYQSTTSTDPDWAGGNFVYPLVTSNLPATAHAHNVCQYTDDAGNTAQSFPSQAGVASLGSNFVDLPTGQWFMSLANGDVGVKEITQLQLSAVVATGAINYILSHPLYWAIATITDTSARLPAGFSNNGINSAMNLVRIFDDACLYAYYPYNAASGPGSPVLTVVEG